jgi:hypothetical protein
MVSAPPTRRDRLAPPEPLTRQRARECVITGKKGPPLRIFESRKFNLPKLRMPAVWAIAILWALPLLADDRLKDPLSSTHTDLFTIATPGSIRLENSFGELDIDGWDRPEVEVTVIRATERFSSPSPHEAQHRLDSVQVTAKQAGNDVVISTAYPPRNAFTHPLARRSDIEISYRIKAPRASKLVIAHNNGGVNVSDISGDIHATVINGQITLTLAAAGQYAIDAKSTIGDVYSDFEGRAQRRQIVGEDFGRAGTAPATNLYLRVRLGDILIQKLHGPPTE